MRDGMVGYIQYQYRFDFRFAELERFGNERHQRSVIGPDNKTDKKSQPGDMYDFYVSEKAQRFNRIET